MHDRIVALAGVFLVLHVDEPGAERGGHHRRHAVVTRCVGQIAEERVVAFGHQGFSEPRFADPRRAGEGDDSVGGDRRTKGDERLFTPDERLVVVVGHRCGLAAIGLVLLNLCEHPVELVRVQRGRAEPGPVGVQRTRRQPPPGGHPGHQGRVPQQLVQLRRQPRGQLRQGRRALDQRFEEQ